MRKIKDIQADIKAVRAEARAAVQRLEAEAQQVREANAVAKADKAEGKAIEAMHNQAAKDNAAWDKARRAEAQKAKAQAMIARANAQLAAGQAIQLGA
jgi:hypothetical protein